MEAKRPRAVIWITTDHMRYDCIGAHGAPALHTPNLDALVRGGVTFSGCYANNPLCMPSRCSFMTGCYPQQTGVMENGHELPADFRPTVGHCFSGAGYRTVQIGKLHFQAHEDHDLDPRARHSYGFDVFQLSEEPGCYEDAYRTWLRGEHPDLVEIFTVPRPMSPERHAEGFTFKVLDAPWQASHSGWIATQACRYLGAWGLRADAQFMHLGFYAPHPPLNPTEAMFAPYRGVDVPPPARSPEDWNDPGNIEHDVLLEYRRHFYAMVTGVDLALGMLVDELKRLGLFDDTLLVFGSDHGDACGDHGRYAKGTSYYESIMHLPWVLHWPNGLGRQGREVEGLVEMVDVLPTLLGLSDIPVPPAMGGRSYADALRGGDPIEARPDVYAVHGDGDIMLRTDSAKYLRYAGRSEGNEVLYDLARDPGEFSNVAGDPAYVTSLREMRDRAFARTVEASRSVLPRRLKF